MTTSVRLNRQSANIPWGFRIHGGKDFNTPLIVLKVNGGSVSEQCGLSPGDALLRINNVDALDLKHKEAQDLILQSGNLVELVVQKGATSTWGPKVTPLGEFNTNQKVYTKTSLKKDLGQKYVPPSGINLKARPFASGTAQDGKSLVNKQFNSPINMYSEQNLAETLSAQAEVLAGGAIGVNFKKNEKEYKYEDSEVYKMLKEVENAPPEQPHHHQQEDHSHGRINVGVTPYSSSQKSPIHPPSNLPSQQSLMKSVQAPVTKPDTTGGKSNPNLCAECDRLIVGVFVRIKEKNLHVECFRCSTCGQSLKNIGYFNINNKLYCDVHAKTVAKANPPAPGLEPYATYLPSEDVSGSMQLQALAMQQQQQMQMQIPPPLEGQEQPVSVPPTEQILQEPMPKPIPVESIIPPPQYETIVDPFSQGEALPTKTAFEAPFPMEPTPINTEITTLTPASAPSAPRTIPINVNKPFSYMKQPSVDTYASNVAPMPYHHSPTQTHHVTAPKSPVKTPTQNQLFSSTGSSSSSSKQIFESKTSSSSFSETITKSGGKFVWPPQRTGEDEVMMASASELGSSGGGPPQQQQSSSYTDSSSFSSTFGQSGGTTIPIQTAAAPASVPTYTPNYAPYGSTPGYKPVAPPKPGFKQQQVPYKPVTSLLTTANKTAPAPSSVAPPAFGGPSSFGGGGGLTAGPPLAARGKQFSKGMLPSRGRGILTQPGPRIAVCSGCQRQIRGPFITASGGKIYCPDHFKCNTPNCHRALIDIGYVEERGALYCEFCWESYLAPECGKCRRRIKNECLNAIGQHFHPTCFLCTHCNAPFGNNPFYLEDGRPYCDKDWNEMFTTKCYACGYPIEAGDRWVEAMNNNYHSQCFNCSACKKNLEGQSFFAKGGRPFCKQHAR